MYSADSHGEHGPLWLLRCSASEKLDNWPCLSARMPAAKQQLARLPLERTLHLDQQGKICSLHGSSNNTGAPAYLSYPQKTGSLWKDMYICQHLLCGSASTGPIGTRLVGKDLLDSWMNTNISFHFHLSFLRSEIGIAQTNGKVLVSTKIQN